MQNQPVVVVFLYYSGQVDKTRRLTQNQNLTKLSKCNAVMDGRKQVLFVSCKITTIPGGWPVLEKLTIRPTQFNCDYNCLLELSLAIQFATNFCDYFFRKFNVSLELTVLIWLSQTTWNLLCGFIGLSWNSYISDKSILPLVQFKLASYACFTH